MLSSLGNTFSSSDLIAWSKQSGTHDTRGLMKSPEDGSTLSIDIISVITDGSRSDPRPHSSHMLSFSLVYIQAGRARSWSGAMHFNKKSNSTIIDVKPYSARNWILFNTRR
jgi:hypothetical protein